MTNVSDSEPEGPVSEPEDVMKSDNEDTSMKSDVDEMSIKSDAEEDNTSMKSDTEDTPLKSAIVKMKSDAESKSPLTVNKLLQLPVSRIKTIMKSSPELANVKPESYILITRATELFISYLAKRTLEMSAGAKTIEYGALSTVVSQDECLDFLEEIVPFKIKMKDYWAKYGRPKPKDDEVVIVDIESNGSSSSSSHGKHIAKTPNASGATINNSLGKTPKSANSLNNSLKTPKSGSSIPGKATPKSGGKDTPAKGTPGKNISAKSVPGKNTPRGVITGKVTKLNGTPGTPQIPEVICIDD